MVLCMKSLIAQGEKCKSVHLLETGKLLMSTLGLFSCQQCVMWVSVGRWRAAGIGCQGRDWSTPVISADGRLSQGAYNEFKANGLPE